MVADADTRHICELHPLLALVSIPGSGLGYRVVSDSTSTSIQKGQVLLTESSICSGPLAADSADACMVSQFLKQVKVHDCDGVGCYRGNLSMAALTMSEGVGVDGSDPKPFSPAWVQRVLDNNVYQCRRDPRSSALFCALARFNHSCDPNAVNDACRTVARVRAVRDIAPGEQVNISYVPLGHDLRRRTEALDSFGFACACARCIRERAFDPSIQCGECGECGEDANVAERHEAVVSVNAALDVALRDVATNDNYSGLDLNLLRASAETALLLAPFATHPDTIQLHRGLVRLLLVQQRHEDAVMEQLREIQRLDLAHGGAKHRDLHFLRCFARLVQRCQKGCAASVKEHVEVRWANLCLLHFGERTAPDAFMADAFAAEDSVQYIPIGRDGERLALLDGNAEIDLSGHEIGDAGCAVLCAALSQVSHLVVLDLDSNGLSSVGGIALGSALAAGAAPLLEHLDLMCNSIGSAGACALAAALETRHCSSLLTYLDLHGNDIGDDGCAALGAAFSAGAGARLVHLNLSANSIDMGCASLSAFLGCDGDTNNGRMLAHLDLSENAIECCSSLFCSSDENEEGREAVVAPSLTYLNVRWNCIADFEPFRACLTQTRCCTALAVLRLEGNVLSDRECNQFYATLKASGAMPMLECEEDNNSAAGFACEEDDNDELRLQQCLRSLANGETINPRVCAEDIWENNGDAAKILCTAATKSAQDSDISNSSDNSHLQDLLERDGFFVVPRLFPQWGGGGDAGNEYTMSTILSTMERLDLAGWPPVFCFMCNAVWELVHTRLWDTMRTLLGDDCVLEPSVFAWSLKPSVASVHHSKGDDGAPSSNSDGQIGQSFGLPHRDYSASESMFDDGKTPKLLNVWVPVNDATLENGCMHIVPREFDANFCRPEDHAHMRSATAVRGTSVCKLRFALHGAQAVPAQAGSLLAWCGNTIHWGSSCSQNSSSPPRKSIAMTFRRRDVAQLEGAGAPITQECARHMPLNMRLALISRSLLLYNQWHTLKGTAVPSAMYHVTSV